MKPARLLLALGAAALGGVAHASTPVQLSLPGVNLPASHQVEGPEPPFSMGAPVR